MSDIKNNIERVLGKIERAAAMAGVPADSVELVAVSKTVEADRIAEAYKNGLRMFGENRVQEYLEKSEILAKDIKWNLIGQLQTNKVKYIIDRNIFLIHSLDRTALAEALQKHCALHNTRVDVLVELNLSMEYTKSGIYEQQVDAFMDSLHDYDRVRVRGFMTIGPNTDEEAEVRRVFARAKAIYDKFAQQMSGMDYLSMGMSGDYEWAILEGSNMVRVGTAVFGQRNYHGT